MDANSNNNGEMLREACSSLLIAPAFTLDHGGEWAYQYLSETLQHSPQFQQVVFDLDLAPSLIAESLSLQSDLELSSLLASIKKMHWIQQIYFQFLSHCNTFPLSPKKHRLNVAVVRGKLRELKQIADDGTEAAKALCRKLVKEDPIAPLLDTCQITFTPRPRLNAPIFFYDASLLLQTGYISYREEKIIGAQIVPGVFSNDTPTLQYFTDSGRKVEHSPISSSGLCEVGGQSVFCSYDGMEDAILSQLSSVTFRKLTFSPT